MVPKVTAQTITTKLLQKNFLISYLKVAIAQKNNLKNKEN